MYAMTVDEFNGTFFLTNHPGNSSWDFLENVRLDLSADLQPWPDGMGGQSTVLCRSVKNESHFALFRKGVSIDTSRFIPTGRKFCGVFEADAARRLIEILPSELRILAAGEEDAPAESTETAGERTR